MIFLLNFFWFLHVFLNSSIPVGGLSVVKTIFFLVLLLTSIISILFYRIKIKVSTFLFLVLPYFILIVYYIETLALSRHDGGGIHQLVSMSCMLLSVQLGLILCRRNLLSSVSVFRGLILGLFTYGTVKLLITTLIFFKVLPLSFISFFSPDMTSLGNIGLPGFHRFASVNDFLVPFVYFFIFRAKLSDILQRIVKVMFLVTILLSFTRSVWAIFAILFFISNMRSIKFTIAAIGSVFIISSLLVYLENYTDFSILTSIEHRLFVEGSGSTSEKVRQSEILVSELEYYAIYGKGLGTYVERYIRNERLKYGYEVSWLIYSIQFGLPVLTFWLLYLFSPFLTFFQVSKFKYKQLFPPFCMFLFLSIGFTNPIILGNLTALLYLFFYLCSREEYQYES